MRLQLAARGKNVFFVPKNLDIWWKSIFRCASISWFQVVSQWVSDVFRLAHLRVFQSYSWIIILKKYSELLIVEERKMANLVGRTNLTVILVSNCNFFGRRGRLIFIVLNIQILMIKSEWQGLAVTLPVEVWRLLFQAWRTHVGPPMESQVKSTATHRWAPFNVLCLSLFTGRKYFWLD